MRPTLTKGGSALTGTWSIAGPKAAMASSCAAIVGKSERPSEEMGGGLGEAVQDQV